MAHSDVLLERNARIATTVAHEGLPIYPRLGTLVLTCVDPRTDPADFLGLEAGDALVLRNAGGRVTPAVIDDLAFLGYLSETRLRPDGPLFEIAVVHHTKCGTSFLADDDFRHAFVAHAGGDDDALRDEAVTDPERTVRHDVELLRAATQLPDGLSVSGHVYDVETGTVRTVVPAVAIHGAA